MPWVTNRNPDTETVWVCETADKANDNSLDFYLHSV